MIAAFRDGDRGSLPYGEKIGAVKMGKPGFSQTLGAVSMRFGILAGKGSSRYEFQVRADSFDELASKMIEANPDAAIRAFGAALERLDDPTIKACGEILSDQRKLASATAPASAPAAAPVAA